MNSASTQPKLEKFLRYLSAYASYLGFILAGFGITWCLRSDIFLLMIITAVPQWITNLFFRVGSYVLFIPIVLCVAGLESYMNDAAKKKMVRPRVLKVLKIEGVIGLVVLGGMGILTLCGYPPSL